MSLKIEITFTELIFNAVVSVQAVVIYFRDMWVSSHPDNTECALNTQQITDLAMRETHLSSHSWPGAQNINSSGTVAGQFSFLREGSETDWFNLIYLSQCCVTWQIVSHVCRHKLSWTGVFCSLLEVICSRYQTQRSHATLTDSCAVRKDIQC